MSCFLILQLANHWNITLSKDTLPLLKPLGDSEHDGLQNASKYFKHKRLLNSWHLHKHGCNNDCFFAQGYVTMVS